MFTPLVGWVFSLKHGGGEQMELTLFEALSAQDHRPSDQREGRGPFSLVFGCATHALPQGTYRLVHESLGAMVIIVSPFEPCEQGHKLEAVFA